MFSWAFKSEKVIYYDFETTGLNQYHDKIIEYAFMTEKQDNKDKEVFTNLVNPETKLDSKIVSITNITNEMLVDKNPIWQHVSKMIKFIESDYSYKYLK